MDFKEVKNTSRRYTKKDVDSMFSNWLGFKENCQPKNFKLTKIKLVDCLISSEFKKISVFPRFEFLISNYEKKTEGCSNAM